jgi:biotin operon repressor
MAYALKGISRKAIKFHIEGLREQRQPIPQPCSSGELIEIPIASNWSLV